VVVSDALLKWLHGSVTDDDDDDDDDDDGGGVTFSCDESAPAQTTMSSVNNSSTHPGQVRPAAVTSQAHAASQRWTLLNRKRSSINLLNKHSQEAS
jgi:Flp pilus assembly protein TadG